MPIALACPECGKTYELADALAGKKGRCKQCSTVFLIPNEITPSPVFDEPIPAPIPPVVRRPVAEEPAEPRRRSTRSSADKDRFRRTKEAHRTAAPKFIRCGIGVFVMTAFYHYFGDTSHASPLAYVLVLPVGSGMICIGLWMRHLAKTMTIESLKPIIPIHKRKSTYIALAIMLVMLYFSRMGMR